MLTQEQAACGGIKIYRGIMEMMFIFQTKSISLEQSNPDLCSFLKAMTGAAPGCNKYIDAQSIRYSGVDYLKTTFPILSRWPEVKDCFNKNTRILLNLAYDKAYLGKGNTEIDFYCSSHLQPNYAEIKFSSVDGFLKFNNVIGKDLSEEGKVGLLAAWGSIFNKGYDYKREKWAIGSRPAREVLERAFSNVIEWEADPSNPYSPRVKKTGDIGICGDINGSVMHDIAAALGLEQAAAIIPTTEGGHVISLIRGKNGFYTVDYWRASYLGKDFEAAQDLVYANERDENGKQSMRYSYFMGSGSKGAVFDPGATRTMLDRMTGLSGEELMKGFSVKAAADSYGSAGASVDYGFKRLTVGAFVLNSQIANTLFGGMKIDYAATGVDKEGGRRSSILLPSLSLATMLAKDETGIYPLLIGQIVPFMRDQALWNGTRLRITPLSVGFGYTAPENADFEAGSSLGVVSEFGKDGKKKTTYVSADFRYTPRADDFYNIAKPDVAVKASAGFNMRHFGASISLKPQSIDNLVDVNLQGTVPVAKAGKKTLDVVLFMNGELLPAKVGGEAQKLSATPRRFRAA
ncbi:MAG: hypothetical protein NTX79_00775 [Candidatus Micrarchaeota archaeon]|nr:hypothetical protein [Candidatus Micrarchaeota archaeon]